LAEIRTDRGSSTQHRFVPAKIAEPRQRFLLVKVAQPTDIRPGQGGSTRQTFLLVRVAQPHRDSYLSKWLNPTQIRTGQGSVLQTCLRAVERRMLQVWIERHSDER